MTITTTWATVRAHAIDGFNGELPTATTEQALIDAFQLEPLAVMHARDQVIEDFRAGKCRSGFAVWRKRVETVTALRDVQVDISERPKAITIAETWIRNAGGYIDREDELISELFDPHIGRLRHWPDLQPRMTAYWLEQRHRFQQAEREAEERQARHATTRERIRSAIGPSVIDPDKHAKLILAEVERARLAYLEQLAPDEADDPAQDDHDA